VDREVEGLFFFGLFGDLGSFNIWVFIWVGRYGVFRGVRIQHTVTRFIAIMGPAWCQISWL
jgi:hypothetical protein